MPVGYFDIRRLTRAVKSPMLLTKGGNCMENRNGYLSAARVMRASLSRYILGIPGGVLTAFFLFGLILCFTDASLREDWWVALFMLLPSVWLLWTGVRSGRDLELARRYDAAFSADQDGILTPEKLTAHSGKSEAQLSAELDRLFRKGYFKGCTLQRKPLAVILTGTQRSGERYVTVNCPHCGGPTRLRAGRSGKCEYCGSAIRDEK